MAHCTYKSSSYQYARVSLTAAAYREGEIEVDGTRKRLVLLDYNSNGRFDDEGRIGGGGRNGEVSVTYGDKLMIDPKSTGTYGSSLGVDTHYVSKLVKASGKFFRLDVSAPGDSLSLTPAGCDVGYITNSNTGIQAIIYGDAGAMAISGGGSEPILVPAGDWKLAWYTIHGSGGSTSRRSPAPTSHTVVSARGTQAYQAVTVRGGQTVEMPFGAPFSCKVTARPSSRKDQVSLALSIVGSGGEICNNLLVSGRRPAAPKFTITSASGQQVHQDQFRFG